MSDTDATQARQDVVADIDEILEHVINAKMPSMPYDVYSELFDAIDGLGVKVEKLQDENAKLRKLIGAYHEYCLCNQYSKKSAHQLITEIEDMICELGIEVDG